VTHFLSVMKAGGNKKGKKGKDDKSFVVLALFVSTSSVISRVIWEKGARHQARKAKKRELLDRIANQSTAY
jgi:hypothetical protein